MDPEQYVFALWACVAWVFIMSTLIAIVIGLRVADLLRRRYQDSDE